MLTISTVGERLPAFHGSADMLRKEIPGQRPVVGK